MNPLSQLNIFEFLGIKNLSKEEEEQYLTRISRIAIQQAIEQAVKDKKLNLETLETLSKQETDSNELQNKLLQEFPQLTEYIENAVNNLKIEILRKQIDDSLQIAPAFPNEDFTSVVDLRSYIEKTTDELDIDILKQKLNLFRDFQDKLSSKINA